MAGTFGPRVDGLVRRHENAPGVVSPDLAQSWEITNGGKTYTFKLRSGVKWHDGQPFSSADVVAHFNRIANPPAHIYDPRKTWFEPVESIEAVDDLTVQFNLKFPFAPFINYLANGQAGAIMAKHILDANNQDLSKVSDWPGTGPFKFVKYTEDQLWEYERNGEYWNVSLPFLDKVENYIFRSSGRATAPYMAGRLDFFRMTNKGVWTQTDGDDSLNRKVTGGGFTWYLFMNPDKKPFNDIRVRQAFNLLLDRGALAATTGAYLQKVYNYDMWIPYESAWGPKIVGDTWKNRLELKTDEDSRALAISTAKELLTMAGYGNGFSDELRVLYRQPGGSFFSFPAEQLEAQLTKHIGPVKFTYFGEDRALTNTTLLSGNYDLAVELYNISEIDHPVQWLGEQWGTGGANNYSNYNNREYNSLVKQLKEALTEEETITISKKMIDILYRDVPAISTPWPVLGCIYPTRLQNMFCGNTSPGGYFSNYMRYDTVYWTK